MRTIADISELIQHTAVKLGFSAAGVAPVHGFPELDYFPAWIAAGHAAEMQYLSARDERGQLKRTSLKCVAPWAHSVVVCAMNYNTTTPYSAEFRDSDRGWISRYAWSEQDYHDALLTRLRQLEAKIREIAGDPALQTRCYVDTGPLVERVYARYAGIGWIGKNTCIINQRLGSWLFLGVILASLEVSEQPAVIAPDRCGCCTRCIEACPTSAILAPYELDAQRCISYLTIEKRGTIAEELRGQMGRHVFGCDICQDVCPWNRRAPVTTEAEFRPRPGLVNPALEWLAEISAKEFGERFRGSPVKRARRSGLRRNAVIAMGNSGDNRFVPALEKLAHDEDEVVAQHARWALVRLTGR